MGKLMGCFFPKLAAVNDSKERHEDTQFSKGSSDIRVRRVNSSRNGECFSAKGGDKKIVLLDNKLNGSKRVQDIKNSEKRRFSFDEAVYRHPMIVVVPKAVQGEQVAAGWPYWLASVASEAIHGWIPRRVDTFEHLQKIGQGTYSSVYKARDLTHGKNVALKRVRFDNMYPESVRFMAREILILRRLDHPNVIKLEGLITDSYSLYLIFEYMEHDLTGLASLCDVKFSEPQVKCYMKQLLSGLDHCHGRGVLHRDIKSSNLLIDNNGILKIADFGLAARFDPNLSQQLTSRVVTLWYRPPELLLGATYYGISVDLWSAGCILGELYARKPIMPGRTEVEQVQMIFKLCGSPTEEYWSKLEVPHSIAFKPSQPHRRCIAESFKDFPPVAVGLMETLLAIDPAQRKTAADALNSVFFTTDPLPSDPSCLPKYAPSKEMDVKLREEESRRLHSRKGRGRQFNQYRRLLTNNANAYDESFAAMQKRQGSSDTKSRNEVFKLNQQEADLGLPIDAHRLSQRELNKDVKDHNVQKKSQSGPMGLGWGRSGNRCNDIRIAPNRVNLHSSERLAASRIHEDPQDDHSQLRQPMGRRDRLSIKAGSRLMGNERPGSKQPILGNEMKNKIRFSGPLLVPNKNMDQMFKEQDRHIQEAARRIRIERSRVLVNREKERTIL